MRNPSAAAVDGLYPTTAMLNGDFSALRNADGSLDTIYDPLTTNPITGARQPFPGNQIPSSLISPIGAKLLAAYGGPAPSAFTLPFNVQGAATNDTTVDQYVARFDENVGTRDAFSTRYNLSNPRLFTGSLVSYATNTLRLRNQLIGQTWAHTFGPTLVNSLRFGYTRQLNLTVPPVAASQNLQQNAGFSNPIPYNLLPEILLESASGSTSFSELPPIEAGGSGQVQEQFQFVDDLSWVKGEHSPKFGVDIRRRRWDTVGTVPGASAGMAFTGIFSSQLAYQPTNVNAGPGGFVPLANTGSPIADLALGQVEQEAYGLGSSTFAFRDDMFSWYAQDSYRATRRLTVNYGLRWDYESPIVEKYGKEAWLVTTSPPCPRPEDVY